MDTSIPEPPANSYQPYDRPPADAPYGQMTADADYRPLMPPVGAAEQYGYAGAIPASAPNPPCTDTFLPAPRVDAHQSYTRPEAVSPFA